MNLLEYRHEMLDRHVGILLPEELEVLSKAVICGAGAGGVGGWTYLSLARLGCLHFKVADPNCFDPTNVNRQAGSNFETVGQNKAETVAKEIQRINPNAQVEIWSDGLRSGIQIRENESLILKPRQLLKATTLSSFLPITKRL